jgi:hypothetical protein
MNDLYFNLINIIFVIVIKNTSIQANNDEVEEYCEKKYEFDEVFLFHNHDLIPFEKIRQKIDSFASLCKSFRE